jgi:predicted enzyme related to lactoylglutathione lyase
MTAPAYNSVAWFQVGTDDPETARRFYGDLFGWTFAKDPDFDGDYDLVTAPGADQPSGGIFATGGKVPNHATFYVVVGDVKATVAAAERAGGKPLMPPTTTPNGLVFADLLDPAGNHFGIFSPPPAN